MRAVRAAVLFGAGVVVGWLTWDSVQAWFDELDIVSSSDW
jgi:hypothetical protein